MNGADVLVFLLLVAVLGGAIFYIIKTKKSGKKCIGCPHSGTCGAKGDCRCGS